VILVSSRFAGDEHLPPRFRRLFDGRFRDYFDYRTWFRRREAAHLMLPGRAINGDYLTRATAYRLHGASCQRHILSTISYLSDQPAYQGAGYCIPGAMRRFSLTL